MSEYHMKQRSIPCDDSWDVIVIGGGPAGCTAAAAAGREGAKTLLVEATGCLGGMGTAGRLNQWMSFTNWYDMIIRGLAQRIFDTCKAGIPHAPAGDLQPIDTELLKRVYDDMVTEFGVKVLFHTMMASVEMEEPGVVDAVILANKAGLSAHKAKVYIDCTSDGDLAAWAGAEYIKGDESSELMPATLCFTMANVDMYNYQFGEKLHPAIADKIMESGNYPEIPDRFIVPVVVGPGIIGMNAGHIWDVDSSDPYTVSDALIKGRRIAGAFRDALTDLHPAFANSYLAATGDLLGVRESRRIIGDYILTLEDYCNRQNFDDEICRNAYRIDVHTSKEEHADELAGKTKNDVSRHESLKPGESHGIPYRCLTPRGLRNVLVAGRSISSERLVQGAIRIMPVCLGLGEAAGIAAAMTAKGNGDVHQVDSQKLCRRLIEEGGYLPGAKA
jgi:hypothetical protein